MWESPVPMPMPMPGSPSCRRWPGGHEVRASAAGGRGVLALAVPPSGGSSWHRAGAAAGPGLRPCGDGWRGGRGPAAGSGPKVAFVTGNLQLWSRGGGL